MQLWKCTVFQRRVAIGCSHGTPFTSGTPCKDSGTWREPIMCCVWDMYMSLDDGTFGTWVVILRICMWQWQSSTNYSLFSGFQGTTLHNYQLCPMHSVMIYVMIVQWSQWLDLLWSIRSIWITPLCHDQNTTHAAICFFCWFCSCHPNSQYISVNTQQSFNQQQRYEAMHQSICMTMIKSDSTIQLPILIQPLDLWRSTWNERGILSPLRQGEQVFTIVRTYFLCAH